MTSGARGESQTLMKVRAAPSATSQQVRPQKGFSSTRLSRDLPASVGSQCRWNLAVRGPDRSMSGWRGTPGASWGQRDRPAHPMALFPWRTAHSVHRGISVSDHHSLGDQTTCPSQPRGRAADGGVVPCGDSGPASSSS